MSKARWVHDGPMSLERPEVGWMCSRWVLDLEAIDIYSKSEVGLRGERGDLLSDIVR